VAGDEFTSALIEHEVSFPVFTNSAIILILSQTFPFHALSLPVSPNINFVLLPTPRVLFCSDFPTQKLCSSFHVPPFFFSLFFWRNLSYNSNRKYNTWSSKICSLAYFSAWVKLKISIGYMDGILKWGTYYCIICDWNTLQWKGLMR